MASRPIRAVSAALAATLIAAAPAAVREQTGTFAYHGVQQRVSAHLSSVAGNELDLVQFFTATGKPVTQYISVAGAPVHVFLVRDDFRTFAHVHPQVRKNGHFSVRITLDANHRYYAYVDSFVPGVGEQTLRFTLQNGAPPHHLDTTLERPNRIGAAGPYRVELSAARIQANVPFTLSATVMRAGNVVKPPKPQSFDTVAALIHTGSLEYTSVYEGSAGGLWYPGEYDRPQLRLAPLPSGVYRMWLQLTIDNVQYIVPFTLAVQ